MNRIDTTFARLRREGRKGLVTFLTAGDPVPEQTVPLLHTLVASGVDVLELGVPFTDPLADGPVIQRASERALAHDVSLEDVLEMVRAFRADDPHTPVVLMGYANPVERMGPAPFAERAAEVGVDGLLTVDMPPEEAAEWTRPLPGAGVAPIMLVAPTTAEERLAKTVELAEGFIYYVSMTGVTGGGGLDVASVQEHVEPIRARTDLPVAVGFGVRDADSAAAVAEAADAVVVGSALIRTVEAHVEHADAGALREALAAQVADLRRGVDRHQTASN
ncbi:tryptophan synthase alpha chain [Thiohalorhabdus denitrificans]|uniref:Tryptophan synthase alpha chain n=1 Tax=Thiohalorhabdus denitrificans TaxID=381306 RepID=A0A0P9EPM5_9GAMM|nr:tryptophan synthase subunit alpha [Thiohalorhabdus denitrificans]KPV40438.1 tryptophan synthase alpha chain [Thiohalorhabdus denitrificans]SCY60786.1 tryptophan synthase, alpha chain [Thiohalorhabdus denitrificans]